MLIMFIFAVLLIILNQKILYAGMAFITYINTLIGFIIVFIAKHYTQLYVNC